MCLCVYVCVCRPRRQCGDFVYKWNDNGIEIDAQSTNTFKTSFDAFTQCLRWVVHLPVWFGSIRLKLEEQRSRKSVHTKKEKREREKTTRDIYECKQEVNMSVFIIIFMVFLWGFLCLQWIFALFDCDKCLYTYNTHTLTRALCKWYEAWAVCRRMCWYTA